MNSALAMEENNVTHEKMMEFEPLLEASGERNLCKCSDGIGISLEVVQFTISSVRTLFGDSVKRGVLARSVANDTEAHQRMEDWS